MQDPLPPQAVLRRSDEQGDPEQTEQDDQDHDYVKGAEAAAFIS
jgi:hypothetical protein